MPETAVDEHRHPCRTEHDVRATPDARKDTSVNPVAQTRRMQGASERELRLGVTASLALHPLQHLGGRGRRFLHQMLEKVVSYSFAMRTIMLP